MPTLLDKNDTQLAQADAEFLHELSVNPTKAACTLSELVSLTPRTVKVKRDLAGKFRSILQFCDESSEDRCDSVLLDDTIVDVVMGVVLDESNYHLHYRELPKSARARVDLTAVVSHFL